MDAIFETCRAIVPNMNIVTKKSFYVNIAKFAIPVLILSRLELNSWLYMPFYLFLTSNANLDTTIINLVASKYSTQITKCECHDKQITRANLASPIYYIGHLAFINLLYYIPIVGPFIYLPLYATLYGFGIMEYFLVNVCTDHRYKYFDAIFIWSFLVGGTAHLLTWITCYLLFVQNSFFYTAILNFYTTQIIMNAIFKPQLNIIEYNIFHLSRSATSHIIKTSVFWLLEKLDGRQVTFNFLEYDYIFKYIIQRDVCKFIIHENQEQIEKMLTTALNLAQKTNVLGALNYFGEMFPGLLSEKNILAIKILKKPGTIEILLYLQKLFKQVVDDPAEVVLQDFIRSRSPSLEWDLDGEYVVLKHPIN